MSQKDHLLRAIARLRALRDNLPDTYEVEDAWVNEFHDAVGGLQRQLSMELEEFRLSPSVLYRSVSSSNYITGEVRYRDGLWCQRTMLLQKVDALLYYLRELYGGIAG